MDNSDWLYTRDIVETPKGRRDNDIRVSLHGQLVLIKLLTHHGVADMWVFQLDEESDGYRNAIEAAGDPDGD